MAVLAILAVVTAAAAVAATVVTFVLAFMLEIVSAIVNGYGWIVVCDTEPVILSENGNGNGYATLEACRVYVCGHRLGFVNGCDT